MPRPAPRLVQNLPGPLVDLLRRVNNLRGIRPRDLADAAKLRVYWAVAPYTHVRWKRFANVFDLAAAAAARDLPGSFVECGVWRGGCAGVLADRARQEGRGRLTWLFDSFAGLPAPTAADGAEAAHYAGGRADGALSPIGRCVGPLADVRRLLFDTLAIDEGAVRIVPGWFQDTLAATRDQIGPIAVLRLDGDWYASTKVCLETLYDLVVPGGYVIVDDYGDWPGCRRATDEFLAARGLDVRLERIDRGGRWFAKPA